MLPITTLLPNGLRVIASPQEGASVTMLLLFPVGSRYEAERIGGISHYVEHLLFKGTTRRPTTLHIAKELDGLGAEYNAFTGKEYTGYYIKTTPENAEHACDVLSDIMFHSLFAAGEVERERGVILEEIKMYEDNPIMHIGDLAEQAWFGDQPLGRSIAGKKEVIQGMQRSDIVKYFKTNYRLHEAVFAISGNVTADLAAALAKKYFAKKINHSGKGTFSSHRSVKHERVLVDKRESQQTQLALLFPGFAYADRRNAALSLLSVVLGGNMSSRLFIKIRERLSLCYSIRTSSDQFRDAGYFAVQAGVDAGRSGKAVAAIFKELAKAYSAGVTAAELASAKTYLRGHFSLRLEDSEFIANWFATQALFYPKIKTPMERLAELDAVTLPQVRAVAKEVLRPSAAHLAVIGPHTVEEARGWMR